MVFINEWFPNPGTSNSAAQFVELFNNGYAAVDLRGWFLEKSDKKTFSLSGYSVPANGYLVLPRAETKMALKHSNEDLSLFDDSGHLVDNSFFMGAGKVGKTLSRVDYSTTPSQHFTWSDPTPGRANSILFDDVINVNPYPFNAPLNYFAPSMIDFLLLAASASAILAVLVVYFVKHEKYISKLLFG